MSTVSAAPTAHRRRYLRTALDELTAGVRSQGNGGGRQTSLQIENRTLNLEGWEWDVVAEWSDAIAPTGDTQWKTLVVEALALQARFYTDLARLAEAAESGTDDEDLRSDLHLDAVLAFRILSELQRETGRMVVSGGMDQAKRLTQFRRRLTECLAAGGKALGEDAIKQAEGIAGQSQSASAPAARIRLTPEKSPDKENEDKVQALFELEAALLRREQSRDVRMDPAAAAAGAANATSNAADTFTVVRPRNTTTIRLVLVGVLLLAVAILTIRNVGTRPVTPVATGLEVASFENAPAIRAVVSRPPSLYVLIDPQAWGLMPKLERTALLEQVGQKAGAAGYTGATVRTTAGATVGQWLKSSGAQLVKPGT